MWSKVLKYLPWILLGIVALAALGWWFMNDKKAVGGSSAPVFEFIPTTPGGGPSTSGAMVLGSITVATNIGGNSFGSISGGSTVIAIVGGSNVFGNIGGGGTSTTNYVVQKAPPAWPNDRPPKREMTLDVGIMAVGETKTITVMIEPLGDVNIKLPPPNYYIVTRPQCFDKYGVYQPKRFHEAIDGVEVSERLRGSEYHDAKEYRIWVHMDPDEPCPVQFTVTRKN